MEFIKANAKLKAKYEKRIGPTIKQAQQVQIIFVQFGRKKSHFISQAPAQLAFEFNLVPTRQPSTLGMLRTSNRKAVSPRYIVNVGCDNRT